MKRSAPIDALDLASGLPTVDQVGGFLFITLNRPDQHNRLDPSDIDVIQGVLDSINDSLAVGRGPRAVVLQASGSRTFCSGFTIDAISEQLDDRFERMLDTLESLPMPTVAVIQGGCTAGVQTSRCVATSDWVLQNHACSCRRLSSQSTITQGDCVDTLAT